MSINSPNAKKLHITNIVTKNDPLNVKSITTQSNLLNKFQVCLGKLNDNSTKEVAFTEIQRLINSNKSTPSSLRFYLSALNSYNSKMSNMTPSAKELQCLIYGYISAVYGTELYDILDKPPNLIKTISRMLTQIRSHYLNESSYTIHKACAHSYCELLIKSMPKESNEAIASVFFDPLISLIATGSSKYIQQGAAIIISDLIEVIGNGQCGENAYILLDDLSDKIINQLLKGQVNDNYYVVDCLYKLMTYTNFEHFTFFLKELYERMILIIKQSNFPYQGKLSVLNVLGLIADRLIDNTNITIGYYQRDVMEVIGEMTKDRVHKVQVCARGVLNKWKVIERISNEEEKGKIEGGDGEGINGFNYNDRGRNFVKGKGKENDPFKYAYIDERDYKVRNVISKAKEKFQYKKEDKRNNQIGFSGDGGKVKEEWNENYNENMNMMDVNERKEDLTEKEFSVTDISIESKNEDKNNQSKMNKNNNNNNLVSILKLTLSNLITNTYEKMQNEFNDNINVRLYELEVKINKLKEKINSKIPKDESFFIINNEKYKSIKNIEDYSYFSSQSQEIKIRDEWKLALSYLENNNINEAYRTILHSQDDIYLLRLICITGSCLHAVDRDIGRQILKRMNLIHRGHQIQSILLNLLTQSISINNNEIFRSLDHQEQNEILDSLYEVSKNNASFLCEKADLLYKKILSIS